jgi:flagellar protein FliO/FliZ
MRMRRSVSRISTIPATLRRLAGAGSLLAATCAVAAEPAAKAGESASAGSLLQVLFGLVVVLCLMGALAWLLKRHGGVRLNAAAPVRIVGGIPVGNREKILVVEVADQWIVVGVAPGRITTLATMPRQDGASLGAAMDTATTGSSASAPAKTFSAWLKQTIENRNGK